eukprot:g7640.t1
MIGDTESARETKEHNITDPTLASLVSSLCAFSDGNYKKTAEVSSEIEDDSVFYSVAVNNKAISELFLCNQPAAAYTLQKNLNNNPIQHLKMLMHEMSDAFIALPGGLGTLDELIEVLTWLSIDLHANPIGLLNVQSYYDKFIEFLDFQVEEGFVAQRIRDLLNIADTAEELITKIEDSLTKN